MPFEKEITDKPVNRVADAIYLYAEQDAQHKIGNPAGFKKDAAAIALKWQYYQSIYLAYRKNANKIEKLSLRYVWHEMAKMQAALKPNNLNRILYSKPANYIRNFTNGYNIVYKIHNRKIENIQQEIVHAHNIQSLTENLKKSGFTLSLGSSLERMVSQGFPEFHLRYYDPLTSKNADFVLHFKKVPGTELYYFEKFNAISRPSLHALLKEDHTSTRQTFSVQEQYTARQAGNLVNGRPICKEIDGKETWIYIDKTKQREGQNFSYKLYHFDLEKTLKEYPILQLNNRAQRDKIIDALKAGSSREVNMTINGQQVKYTIEASLHGKGISVLDKYNRLVDTSLLLNGKENDQTEKMSKLLAAANNDTVIDMDAAQRKKKRVSM